MEIGLYAESAGLSSLDETLPRARELGITSIELGTGGQNPRPFLDVHALLERKSAQQELLQMLNDHGMTLSALNISAFPLHPRVGADHTELTRKTMRLAGELGVDRIIAQSGVPGDAPGSSVPNWVTYPWPDDMLDTVRRQWDEGIALWRELADYGASHGVRRICFEMHPLNPNRHRFPFRRAARIIPFRRHDGQSAIRRERFVILRDLVPLRQIGIKIILTSEDRCLLYIQAERECRPSTELDDALVQHGQSSR